MPASRIRSVPSRVPATASPNLQATSHAPAHRLLPQEPCLFRLEMTLPACTDGSRQFGVRAQAAGSSHGRLDPGDCPDSRYRPRRPQDQRTHQRTAGRSRGNVTSYWWRGCGPQADLVLPDQVENAFRVVWVEGEDVSGPPSGCLRERRGLTELWPGVLVQ